MTVYERLADTLSICKAILDDLDEVYTPHTYTKCLYKSFAKQHEYLGERVYVHASNDYTEEAVAILMTSACTLLFQIHSEYQRVSK